MSTPPVDRYLLLAFLHVHEKSSRPAVGAVYSGMAARVERGDFDVLGSPRKGGGITPVALESVAQLKTAPGSALTLNPRPKTHTTLNKKEVLP
jgi:hypothetical protein